MLKISEFILNSCWQIVVVSAIAALGSWMLRNAPAGYRHVLWVVALAMSLVVPLLSGTELISARITSFQAATTTPTRPAAVVQPQEVASQSEEENSVVDHLRRRYSQPISTNSRAALFLTLVYVLFIF